MDWKRVADQAKKVIDERGGPESLKEDADELREIAEGPGTLAEKAKKAAEALREPGAHRGPEAGAEAEPEAGGVAEPEAGGVAEPEAGAEAAVGEASQESEPAE